MAEFDTVSKYLVQTYPGDIARFTLERQDVEVLELLDTEQITLEARRPDSLLRVRLGGEEVVVHTEFQTTGSTRPPMPQRMAGYIWRLIEQYGLPVRSSVVYLRPQAGRNDPGYFLRARPGHRVFFEYRVIRMSRMDGRSVLAAGPPGLLAFAPLMAHPADVTGEAWLRQCVQAAQALPMDPSARSDLLSGLSILSGLVYASGTVSDIISREGIMDIMQESSVGRLLIREWKKEALEEGRREGREQGLEQGIEQGREQGIEQGLRESIRDVLEIRFSMGAAHPLADRLAAIGDRHRLKLLHRAAVQVESLEEFRRLAEAGE